VARPRAQHTAPLGCLAALDLASGVSFATGSRDHGARGNMVDNPFEPKPLPPFDAGPRVLARRGNAYQLPPIGAARRTGRAHLLRQERIGTLLMLLLVVLPFGWFVGLVFGWWGWR
jgi:hypothetical protein